MMNANDGLFGSGSWIKSTGGRAASGTQAKWHLGESGTLTLVSFFFRAVT